MTSELGFEKNRQNCDLYKWKKIVPGNGTSMKKKVENAYKSM